jgi:hypothetical protein
MRYTILGLAFAAMIALSATPSYATDKDENFSFDLVVSSGAKACTKLSPKAQAHATIAAFPPSGPVEKMHVELFNMPPNSDFVIFIIEKPDKPFGVGWYDGDILTDDDGHGVLDIIGRFSTGTFIVSPGKVGSVPTFPDDNTMGVQTAPIQMYHVGIWFNSVAEANAAGCPPNVVTPFTSNHQAGIQVLNTSNFKDDFGPLLHVQ